MFRGPSFWIEPSKLGTIHIVIEFWIDVAPVTELDSFRKLLTEHTEDTEQFRRIGIYIRVFRGHLTALFRLSLESGFTALSGQGGFARAYDRPDRRGIPTK